MGFGFGRSQQWLVNAAVICTLIEKHNVYSENSEAYSKSRVKNLISMSLNIIDIIIRLRTFHFSLLKWLGGNLRDELAFEKQPTRIYPGTDYQPDNILTTPSCSFISQIRKASGPNFNAAII
jgi:hypothetical protein